MNRGVFGCVSNAVLVYAGEQLWKLSEMVQSREWMRKDHTIIVAVGVMYSLLLVALFFGQGKKRVHDKYFADGVRCE